VVRTQSSLGIHFGFAPERAFLASKIQHSASVLFSGSSVSAPTRVFLFLPRFRRPFLLAPILPSGSRSDPPGRDSLARARSSALARFLVREQAPRTPIFFAASSAHWSRSSCLDPAAWPGERRPSVLVLAQFLSLSPFSAARVSRPRGFVLRWSVKDRDSFPILSF
jgi:hypothetical protein